MVSKEKEHEGIVHIYATFNNTLAQLTDLAGNSLGKVSGGLVTKHNRLKANPTIAMFIARRIGDFAKEQSIKSLYVRVRGQTGSTGVGPGANAIIRRLGKDGFKIISIADLTRVARGGPKKEGGRRGRRV